MNQIALPPSGQEEALIQMPFTSHLIELRTRLIRIFGLVLLLFLCLLPFANTFPVT